MLMYLAPLTRAYGASRPVISLKYFELSLPVVSQTPFWVPPSPSTRESIELGQIQ